jgi:hypothetical protein
MLLRINITVITSRTNGPTQQCTRPDARGGRTDRDRKRTSRDKIRGATETPTWFTSAPRCRKTNVNLRLKSTRSTSLRKRRMDLLKPIRAPALHEISHPTCWNKNNPILKPLTKNLKTSPKRSLTQKTSKGCGFTRGSPTPRQKYESPRSGTSAF